MDVENALPRAKSIARRKTAKATLVLGFAPVIGDGHVLIWYSTLVLTRVISTPAPSC